MTRQQPREETAGRTPFGVADELSCYYDSPDEPNNVHLEVRLPGHLDLQAFRDATAAMLAARPRARARRAAGSAWRRGYCWEYPAVPDSDPVACASWDDEHDLARKRMTFLASAPPLDASPPLRFLLGRGPDQDCVILNAHHAAFDGLSCLHLLRSVASRYHDARVDIYLPRSEPSRQAPPEWGPASVDGRTPHDRAAGHQAPGRRRPGRPVARIAAQHTAAADARHLPGYGFHMAVWPGVPAPPPGSGGTVNDLLITAMIVAVGEWNAAHGRGREAVRVTMPVGGHTSAGDEAPMGNLSRLTAVTAHPPANGTGVTELVSSVAAQTRHAKQHPGSQVDPLSAALTATLLPVAVKRRLLRTAVHTVGRLICDTSLITNLGKLADPPMFGAMAPAQLWFSTPAHMPRGLSLGVVTVGERLHLCFRYRRALFDETAAAQFAHMFVTALAGLSRTGGQP